MRNSKRTCSISFRPCIFAVCVYFLFAFCLVFYSIYFCFVKRFDQLPKGAIVSIVYVHLCKEKQLTLILILANLENLSLLFQTPFPLPLFSGTLFPNCSLAVSLMPKLFYLQAMFYHLSVTVWPHWLNSLNELQFDFQATGQDYQIMSLNVDQNNNSN